ncbi:MAG: hypothetical protein ACLPVY_21825 [Acidimicrobiia bacterium]
MQRSGSRAATGFAALASALSGTALTDTDTATGSLSVEQTIATRLGLSILVVSGSAWDSMTAATITDGEGLCTRADS